MYQKKSINMHPFFPPEISDIVLHYLLEIDPCLCDQAKVYYRLFVLNNKILVLQSHA